MKIPEKILYLRSSFQLVWPWSNSSWSYEISLNSAGQRNGLTKMESTLKIHTYINLQLTILMRIQIEVNHLTQMYLTNLRNMNLNYVCEEIDGTEKTLGCTLSVHIPQVFSNEFDVCRYKVGFEMEYNHGLQWIIHELNSVLYEIYILGAMHRNSRASP